MITEESANWPVPNVTVAVELPAGTFSAW